MPDPIEYNVKAGPSLSLEIKAIVIAITALALLELASHLFWIIYAARYSGQRMFYFVDWRYFMPNIARDMVLIVGRLLFLMRIRWGYWLLIGAIVVWIMVAGYLRLLVMLPRFGVTSERSVYSIAPVFYELLRELLLPALGLFLITRPHVRDVFARRV